MSEPSDEEMWEDGKFPVFENGWEHEAFTYTDECKISLLEWKITVEKQIAETFEQQEEELRAEIAAVRLRNDELKDKRLAMEVTATVSVNENSRMSRKNSELPPVHPNKPSSTTDAPKGAVKFTPSRPRTDVPESKTDPRGTKRPADIPVARLSPTIKQLATEKAVTCQKLGSLQNLESTQKVDCEKPAVVEESTENVLSPISKSKVDTVQTPSKWETANRPVNEMPSVAVVAEAVAVDVTNDIPEGQGDIKKAALESKEAAQESERLVAESKTLAADGKKAAPEVTKEAEQVKKLSCVLFFVVVFSSRGGVYTLFQGPF